MLGAGRRVLVPCIAVEFVINERGGYVESVVSGDVPDGGLGFDPYENVPDGSRLLIDCRGIGEVGSPVPRWAAMTIGLELRGFKAAVVVRNRRHYDMFDEAFRTARVDRERQFSVFLDRTEAELWLRSDGVLASRLQSD